MTNKKITNKNNQELKAMMAQVASEVLSDPDFGKELSSEAKKRLSSVSDKDLDNSIPLSKIKKKYL